MSQVRKFNSGGTTPTALFDAGGRNVDKDDFIYFAKKNKSALLANNSISGDDAAAVSSAYDELLQSIDKGEIKSMDMNGGLIDPSGKFAKLSESNSAYGKATTLLDLIVMRMNTAESGDNNKKYTDTKGLIDVWNREFFGGQYQGSESDQKLWMNLDTKGSDGKYSRTGRMSKLAEIIDSYLNDLKDTNYNYEGSSFTNKEDHISKLTKARDLLKSGTYDNNLVRALMGIGMTSSLAEAMLTDGSEVGNNDGDAPKDESKTPTREEAINAAVKSYMAQNPGVDESLARQYAEKSYDSLIANANAQLKQNIEDIDYNNWFSKVNTGFTPAEQSVNTGTNYNFGWYFRPDGSHIDLSWINTFDSLMKIGHSYLFNTFYNSQNDAGKRQLRALLEATANEAYHNGENQYMKSLGNHLYLLKGYVDYNHGTCWVYDAANLKLKKMKTTDIQAVSDLNKAWWKTHIMSNKQGGRLILKAANGADMATIMNFNLNKVKEAQKAKEAQKVEEEIKSGKTLKQAQHDSKSIKDFDLTGSDGVRLGAAIADLTGAVAAYIPGGSLYSLGEGIVADIARAGADYSDSGDAWGSLKNLGIGLGATALASLPIVGTAGKIGKVWKGIKVFLPYLFAGYSTIKTAGPAMDAYKNIENGKGTLEDYTKILSFVTAATNGVKTVGNGIKAAKIKNVANTGESDITIKGKNGNIHLDKTKLEELKTCTSRAEMQEKIKTLTGDQTAEIDFGHINGLNPLSSSLKANGKHFWNQGAPMNESTIYDWNRVGNKRYSSDVSMLQFKMPEINILSRFNMGYNPGKGYTPTVQPLPTTPSAPVVADPDEILAGTVGAKNGGKLEFVLKHRQGGLIYKYLAGSKTYSGVRSVNSNWNRDVFSKYKQYILDKLDDNYANWLNAMLTKHYNMYTNAGGANNQSWRDNAYRNQEVTDYQTEYGKDTYFNKNGIANAYDKRYDRSWNNKKRDGKDVTSNFDNNSWIDGAFSSITDDRRLLGRKEDWDEASLNAFNEELKQKGYKMSIHDNGYYYIDKLNPDGTTQTALTTDLTTTQQDPALVNPINLTLPLQEPSNVDYNELTAKAIKMGDLANIINTNKQMVENYKKIPAVVKDPIRVEGKRDLTSYDYSQEGVRQQASAFDEGRRIQNGTSSGRLGVLARLSSISKGIDAKRKLEMEAQKYRQLYADENVDARNKEMNDPYGIIQTGNFNNASLTNKIATDIQAENAGLSNIQTNLSTNAEDIAKELLTKSATDKARIESLKPALYQAYYKNQIGNSFQYNWAVKELAEATKNNDTTRVAQLQNYINALQNYTEANYYNTLYKKYGILIPVSQPLNFVSPKKTTLTTKAKNGGTLEDNIQKARMKDNDRFDKGVLELIKQNQKAISDSTAITKAIINKVMSKF